MYFRGHCTAKRVNFCFSCLAQSKYGRFQPWELSTWEPDILPLIHLISSFHEAFLSDDLSKYANVDCIFRGSCFAEQA